MKESIIFFGSSSSSLKLINKLLDNYHVPLIITTKHKNNIIINHYHNTNDITVLEIEKLTSPILKIIKEYIKNYHISTAIVADFGLIIPADFILAFKKGIINVHYSLLPKYRGASPIESVLIAHDSYTGISLMLIEPSLDSGPILTQYKYKIKGHDNQISLTNALDDLAISHINQDVHKYLNADISPTLQNHAQASFCSLIKKEHGRITNKDSSDDIIAKTRAFYHWPSAWLIYKGKRIKIYEYGQTLPMIAEDNDDISFISIGAHLYLKTNKALLEIKKLQIEGKAIIDSKSAINGYKSFFNL